MKTPTPLGIGFVIVLLLAVLFSVAILGFTVYGVILCVQASVLLGVIALLIEPAPLVIALVTLAGHPDVPMKLAKWLHLV